MSPLFTRDEIRRQLREQNVGEAAIERALALQFGDPMPVVAPPAVTWPLTFTLPWSALVSDNRKYAPAVRNGASRLLLRPEYRAAKEKARSVARAAMGDVMPCLESMTLTARVWVPDHRPGHDVCNFAKCLCDALNGVVYRDDAQLHRVTWERAGVDVDRPRAEITVTPV